MSKPKSAISFHRRFRSEEACVAFLEQSRWNGEPICPRCGCLKCYRIKTRKNYFCSGCRRNFTVRHGTVFEDSKLPLLTWFSAVWLVTTARAGISSIELGEKLGISQQAAWFVLHRIQFIAAYGTFDKMSGHVEMDDTEMMRREGKRTTVVGMTERDGGAKLKVVDSVDAYTVHNLATQNVEQGSKLTTDAFRSYSRLGESGFDHTRVNHGESYVQGEHHTNTVEGLFGNFQRRLRGVHIHVSDKHMQRYCDAYSFRYNTRELSPVERFENWFRNAAHRLTYKALTA